MLHLINFLHIDTKEKDLNCLSFFSIHGEVLSSVTPDQQRIPRKNKRNKTSDTSIIRKEPIQEPVNPRKMSKENTITDIEKSCPKETPPLFWHKVD